MNSSKSSKDFESSSVINVFILLSNMKQLKMNPIKLTYIKATEFNNLCIIFKWSSTKVSNLL